MPNAIAMTAEYFPSRNCAFTTMVMFSGFPLGATTLGGLPGGMADHALRLAVGVHRGGILLLLLAAALVATLPESFRHLVLKGRPAAEAAARCCGASIRKRSSPMTPSSWCGEEHQAGIHT